MNQKDGSMEGRKETQQKNGGKKSMSRNFIEDETEMICKHLKIFNLIINQKKEN